MVDSDEAGDISTFLTSPDRKFVPGVVMSHSRPGVLLLRDLDQDGALDLAVGGAGPTAVYRGKGDGDFEGSTVLGGGGTVALEVVDFNRDGRLDVVHLSIGFGALLTFGVCAH